MSTLVYRKISCLVTNSGLPAAQGIRPRLEQLGIIHNAALVFSETTGVLWHGADKALPRKFRSARYYDCRGLTAYPGFVDPHTHPAFAGDRTQEFTLRMAGATYKEIAESGGGILRSVAATRAISKTKLAHLVRERLETAYNFGVRAIEAKSGYGLTAESELLSLEAIRGASQKFDKILVLPTCMAAHAIPVEYRGKREQWVRLVCEKILPLVAKRKLARFVDVFCDAGYYTNAETEIIFAAARTLGFSLRLHGDELENTGGAELAARVGALSVDHLLKVSESGIRALANSNTIATLLPGTSLYLREPPAPARKLIDAGVAVALATDFNPGTSPTQNLPLIASLAAIQLGMSPAEIITALTWNAARALGISDRYGALLPGYLGGPVFSLGDDPAAVLYHLAPARMLNPPQV